MNICCAFALVSLRSTEKGLSALVRITAPGQIIWRRHRLARLPTPDDLQAVAGTAARHLVPEGGCVRLCLQGSLLGYGAVQQNEQEQ